jgi:hypothetical protein
MIIFLGIGIVALTVGLLSIFSSRFDLFLHKSFPDSVLDKKMLSSQSRYLIRRYISGIQGIIAGITCIALYILSDRQVFDTVASWFHTIFAR